MKFVNYILMKVLHGKERERDTDSERERTGFHKE